MLDPAHPDAPKFWMWETSGVLRPAIMAYIDGHTLTAAQCATMRAYLRQWVGSPVWGNDRWNPKNAIDGRHVWLPVEFRHGVPMIGWHDEWDLCIFDK